MRKTTHKLALSAETVRRLASAQLTRVKAGLQCSDPTCQICDTIKPQSGCAD